MNNNKAQELIVHLQELETLVGEEMTNNPMNGGAPMGFPSEYRGLAKVVRVKDEAIKKWWGQSGQPLFIDIAKGETNLLTPEGELATMQQVSNWFDLEAITTHP